MDIGHIKGGVRCHGASIETKLKKRIIVKTQNVDRNEYVLNTKLSILDVVVGFIDNIVIHTFYFTIKWKICFP